MAEWVNIWQSDHFGTLMSWSFSYSHLHSHSHIHATPYTRISTISSRHWRNERLNCNIGYIGTWALSILYDTQTIIGRAKGMDCQPQRTEQNKHKEDSSKRRKMFERKGQEKKKRTMVTMDELFFVEYHRK